MYTIYSSLSTDEPIMMLDQQIGPDKDDSNTPYIDGAEFQRELLELDNQGYKCIKIYINSPGGNVLSGWNICNAICNSKTPVDTYNIGLAASMAAVIFMAGRKRIMTDYSSMMVHAPFGGTDNQMLAAMREGCIKLLSAKCSIDEKEVSYLVDRETWMYPAECLAKGFCTEIQYTADANVKRMPKVNAMAMWKEAKAIQANIFPNSNNNSFMDTPNFRANGLSSISSYLGLNVEAAENSVLSEVKARITSAINAKEDAESQLAKMKKVLDKQKADYDEMLDKYNQAQAAIAGFKQKETEAQAKVATDAKAAADALIIEQEKVRKIEAKATIEKYVPTGRIVAEVVDMFVEQAMKTSIPEVVALIEKIPLNKSAASATSVNTTSAAARDTTVDPSKVAANAMTYQAEIQARILSERKKSA